MSIKRGLYITLGALGVVLGALGVVVPGLPTTPFVLAASWLFYRSSPRLQERLLNSPLGAYIRSYKRNGGMRPKVKMGVVVLMCTMVGCSIALFIHNTLVDWIVGVAGVVGCIVVIFFVPSAQHHPNHTK